MIQTVAADEPSAAVAAEEQKDTVGALPPDAEQTSDEQPSDQVEDEAPETNEEETEVEESEDTKEIEAGANEAAPETADGVATTPIPAPVLAAVPNQPQAEDRRSDIERQPYEFEKCTVQIAIQLLPSDGDANGRQVLVGVRSHQDAPIVRLMRWNELGALPLTVMGLVEQLQGELPARGQAAKERLEKEKEALVRRHTKASPAKEAKAAKQVKPVKPKTVQAAAAPAPSVLTNEQRAKAVSQVAVDDKRQPALF